MTSDHRSQYFVSGGTMGLGASSYIERGADHELFTELMRRRYCYVLDARQMGKSSLAVRTLAKLRAEGVRCVALDLTRVGGNNTTPDQWYAGLCREVGRAMGMEQEVVRHWRARQAVSPMQRFFDFLRDVLLPASPEPVVIFIDETDAVLSLPFSADELLAGIREAYNRRAHDPEYERLTFCLLGVAIPTDLIRDPRTTPFNVGIRVELRDFTLRELGKFAEALGPHGDRLIARVHRWTNGHPYLTQSLCQAIASEPATETARDVDHLVRARLLAPDSRQTNSTLADVANRALHAGDREPWPDRFRADLLSAYAAAWHRRHVADDDSNRPVALLKLSGLVRSERGEIRVRNLIYRRVFDREWIRENMPGQELRRQKRAFALGALRSGMVGFVFLAVVGTMAYRNARLAESAQAAARSEREARAEAERFSYRAYVLTFLSAHEAFDKGDYATALKLLEELENQPQTGWEMTYTSKRFHRIGRFIKAHGGRILSMEFLPDGRLFTISTDGFLALWDASTGACLQRFPLPGAPGKAAVYPDGRRLGIIDIKGTLWQFDLATGKTIWQRPVGRKIPNAILVSPDSRYVLLTSEQRGEEPLLLSAETGEKIRAFSAADNAWTQCAAWAPDSRRFVLSYEIEKKIPGAAKPDHTEKTLMYEADGGRKVWERIHKESATVGLRFSEDGRRLVGMGLLGDAVLIDPATGKVAPAIPHGDVYAFSISPLPGNRGWATSALEGGLKFWTPDLKGMLGERHMNEAIWLSAVDPTGRFAATTGTSGDVYVWNVPRGKTEVPALGSSWLSFPGRFVRALVSTSDGSFLLVSLGREKSDDGPFTLRLVRAADGKTMWERNTAVPAGEIVFSPDGKRAAIGYENQMHLLDAATGSPVRTFAGCSAAFSPDGLQIAIGSQEARKGNEGRITVFDTRDWQPTASVLGLQRAVLSLDFSPDGKRLAAAGLDLDVHVFDAATLGNESELHGHNNELCYVRYDGRGAKLYSVAVDGYVRRWNATSGAAESAMHYEGKQGGCRDFVFLPGHRIALRCWGGIQLWDSETARQLLTIPFQKQCGGLAVAPNGDILAAAGDRILRFEH